MKRKSTAALGVLLGLLLATPASAALNAYLSAAKGQKAAITLHTITSPRDAASGLPTGKRTHKPVVFAFELDKSSPLLAGMTVGAKLGEITFSADEAGKAPVTLKDATVQSVEVKGDGSVIKVSGITAGDDWETPIAALKAATGLDKAAAAPPAAKAAGK